MSPKRLITALLLIGLLFLLQTPVARGQGTESEEAFVYGINAAVPGAVYGTFAPPIVERVYLLAEQTSILSPRLTGVYFWPITNEYRAAWTQLNEPVAGELEILQGRQVVETLEQVSYTIHFTSGPGLARPQLYIGEAAVVAEEEFQAAQAAYQRASLEYQQAREAWLVAARDVQAQGLDSSTLPPAPEPPEVFDLFSTGLHPGFPISLPAGNYEIRLRQPDGTIMPGSERDLEIVAPRRTAVGYEVIPEDRWTFPEPLDDLADVLLAGSDMVVYLRPRVVREYPALAYERMQDPQHVGDGDDDRWSWIIDETDATLEAGILEVVVGGEVVDRINRVPYFVRQIPGRELGYEILPYAPDNPDTPRVDFAAFRLEFSPELESFQVQMRSLDGALFMGSNRQVRLAPEVSPAPLLLIVLLPPAFGAALLYRRTRRTKPGRGLSGVA